MMKGILFALLVAWMPPAQAGGAPPPTILQLYDGSKSVLSCMKPGATFFVRGRDFRPEQGTWRLAFGGHGIGSEIRVTRWSDTLIEAVFPLRPTLEAGKAYYVAIREANGGWVSSLTTMFTSCSEEAVSP